MMLGVTYVNSHDSSTADAHQSEQVFGFFMEQQNCLNPHQTINHHHNLPEMHKAGAYLIFFPEIQSQQGVYHVKDSIPFLDAKLPR